MLSNAPIATIFGGSGFLGRYITQRLAHAGWRVRVAVRRPNEALFVRTYGVVGQVEPMQANIRDEATTHRAIASAAAVVNCIGVMVPSGKQQFDPVQTEGAGRVARLSAAEGVGRLVHVSAIGADAASDSDYARTKAEGEAAVQAAYADAVILRPSIMFGVEDTFFNRFASMARLWPVLPLVGPRTRFQPVYVDDVAEVAARAVFGEVAPGVYELGGPEVVTFRELMVRLLRVIERRRMLVTVPFWLARMQAGLLDRLQSASFDNVTNALLTRDQVKLLSRDNVVSPGAKGFRELGITPTAMEAVLESYLYAYRPHGQYDAITASADNLRQE
jgi:uncharacterized protein YbjT (DUF2867 family)